MKQSTRILLLVILCSAVSHAQVPVITSLSPAATAYPLKVKIYGSNFSTTLANNVVRFGGIMPQLLSASTDSLQVIAPTNPTYGPVTVTVAGKTGYYWKPFFTTFGGGGFGTSSYTPPTPLSLTANAQTMAFADIDGDGKLDIVLPAVGGTAVRVARNSTPTGGNFSFDTPVDFATLWPGPRGISTADMDGDGKLDMVVACLGAASPGRISVFRNTSTSGVINASSFAASVYITDSSTGLFIPNDVAVGDFDGDGRPDIAAVGQSSSIQYLFAFRNVSSVGSITASSFQNPPVKVAAGSAARRVRCTDFDGDGKVDALVYTTSLVTGGVVASVFRNTTFGPTISFVASVDLALPTGFGEIAAGDLNADGKPDIVCANAPGGAGVVTVFQNNSTSGNIAFGSPVTLALTSSAQGVELADVDGDAKPDIVVLVPSVVHVFRNLNGGGNITTQSFETRVDLTGFGNPTSGTIAIGDLDGDSKPELVNAGYGSIATNVVVLRNRISTGFTPTPINLGTTADVAGVSFITRNNGCIAGRGGIVRTTTDGGTTWVASNTGVTNDINSIRLVGGRGFIVGTSGLICVSTNGGGSWTPFTTGTTVTFNGASFTSETAGWAVGAGGTICIYNGTSWVAQTTGTTIEFKGIYAIGSTGFAVGANGTICRWNGSSWVPQTTGVTITFTDVAFVNDQLGFAVGTGGTICKTTNGGTNWVALNTGLGSINYRSIKLANANLAWVVGDGGLVAQTSDGGTTWTTSGLGVTDDLLGVEFVQGQGVIVGKAGKGFKFSTTLVSVREDNSISQLPKEFALEQNYPNPFNPTTNIRFTLVNSGFTSLKVYDILGREVATLVNENMKSGRYVATFDANKFASGVFFYRLQSGQFSEAKKMILTR